MKETSRLPVIDIGSKVKLSDKYVQENPFIRKTSADRSGIVVGIRRDGRCYYILWDGAKRPQTIFKDFVQIIEN
jgi:hypothetical protein